jgi:hypothetical protein
MVSQVEQLGADSIYCLSKSIIMENTKLPKDADPKRLRYVCVVVQYAGVKLHKEKLGAAAKAIEVARGLEPMGRKSYNFRLVSQEVEQNNSCRKLQNRCINLLFVSSASKSFALLG